MAIVRVNFNLYDAGEDFLNRLEAESSRTFKVFLSLLSSYWRSSVDGPNYTRHLKALSIELSRLRLMLEDSRTDGFYDKTRTEFLYQVLTSVMFPDGEAPEINTTDLEFREFLNNLLKCYYKGSVPSSLQEAVNLLVGGKAKIIENFQEARSPGSGFDISDQFSFGVDIALSNPSEIDIFLADKNIRLILNILRPAHTLYKVRYILKDEWIGQQTNNDNRKIIDQFVFSLQSYGYEDFRKFVDGIYGVDILGTKKPINIINEDHSSIF